jgi:hypothetical protein
LLRLLLAPARRQTPLLHSDYLLLTTDRLLALLLNQDLLLTTHLLLLLPEELGVQLMDLGGTAHGVDLLAHGEGPNLLLLLRLEGTRAEECGGRLLADDHGSWLLLHVLDLLLTTFRRRSADEQVLMALILLQNSQDTLSPRLHLHDRIDGEANCATTANNPTGLLHEDGRVLHGHHTATTDHARAVGDLVEDERGGPLLADSIGRNAHELATVGGQ